MLYGVALFRKMCYTQKEVIIMRKVMYCEKCGNVYYPIISKKCSFCKTKMKILPEPLKDKYNIYNKSYQELQHQITLFNAHRLIGTEQEELRLYEERQQRKQNFVMGELKNSPLFSIRLYQQRIEKETLLYQEFVKLDHEEVLKRINRNTQSIQNDQDHQIYTPQCPICGSSNINKITLTNRAVKTAAFGVLGAMNDAGKTYKCGNCGSKF